MSINSTKKIPLPLAIFDKPKFLTLKNHLPKQYKNKQDFYVKDYKCVHAFLYAYKDNTATYNAYRKEIERLLLWAWLIYKKSILGFGRTDIEAYLKFCQKPPKEWIGFHRVPHYIDIDGERLPNSEWRPFVVSVSKAEAKEGKEADPEKYALSDKAFQEIFTVLNSMYNFFIAEEITTHINPIQLIKQKSKYIRRHQGQKKIRRLSELQWKYVLSTAHRLASSDDKYERTLFIMSSLYSMYLRISELVSSERWSPKMNDFTKDRNGDWWFTTVGKGNKMRQIAVSDAMLQALMRWRKHLGLSPTPPKNDETPLISKEKGSGGITSSYQIRKIVQHCFDEAELQLASEGFTDEALELREATVHWLRHTGISDDVQRRPREHVRDDAGHASGQTTDKYIDVELKARHDSAKNKPIDYGHK